MKPKITRRPGKVAVLDTETALRWFWYDGKGTTRLQMWVVQFLDEHKPRGQIILPDIILKDSIRRYRGLPVVSRKDALKALRATLTEANLVVGHNVRAFDYGTINGELLLAGMEPLPKVKMIDTLKDLKPARGQSKSLGNLLPRLAESHKEHVHPAVWELAFNEYNPGALKEVWNRCVTDVFGHWDLHVKLAKQGWLK